MTKKERIPSWQLESQNNEAKRNVLPSYSAEKLLVAKLAA